MNHWSKEKRMIQKNRQMGKSEKQILSSLIEYFCKILIVINVHILYIILYFKMKIEAMLKEAIFLTLATQQNLHCQSPKGLI